jgi:hypothetical protein
MKRGDNVRLEQGGGSWSTVSAGILDEKARQAYSLGQCGALAIALAERTGWPVYWLGRRDCAYDESCFPEAYSDQIVTGMDGPQALCPCQVEHLGVLRPDGSFIDIEGARSAQQAMAPRESEIILPAQPQLLADLRIGGRGWPRAHLGAARMFAAAIVKQLARP